MDDEQIRQIVLNDEALYQQAREYGMEKEGDSDKSGDECMYDHLYEFIEEHRAALVAQIKRR